jgi:hypothetical protein
VHILSDINFKKKKKSNYSATSALIKINIQYSEECIFFAATELTVCPIPSFADVFYGALVLWRRATAPCCGALVMQDAST